MKRYELTVTYQIDVLDEEELVRVGAALWTGQPDSGWAVSIDGDEVEEVSLSEVRDVELSPEASLVMVISQQPYPTLPGARIAGMSANAVAGSSGADGGAPSSR